MNKSLLLLFSLTGLCFLTACGGSGGSTAGPATHFAVTASASAAAGTAFNFTLSPLDAANNVVSARRPARIIIVAPPAKDWTREVCPGVARKPHTGIPVRRPNRGFVWRYRV